MSAPIDAQPAQARVLAPVRRSTRPSAGPGGPADPLTDGELHALVRIIRDRSGIRLHEGRRTLIASRLQRRLRACRLASFADYVRLLDGDASGQEVVALLDAIVTNHTAFYREPDQFELLARRVLPAYATAGAPLRVWSAACSTGEEPYSIAMSLLDAGIEGGRVEILASDLSTRALARARTATYATRRVEGLPRDVLRRHFEFGSGPESVVRVRAHVRALVRLRRINLADARAADADGRFHAIFCRNVLIYFDRDVQQRVVAMLEDRLEPGDWLFVGRAESLNGLRHGLDAVAPAAYRRPDC